MLRIDANAAATTPRSSRELLRDRVFASYLVGNFTSSLGNWFQNVAAGVVIFELTGSSTMVGLVGAIQFGMSLVVAPFAGALADRVDRRRLLMVAQALSLVGALALAIWVLAVGGPEGLPGVWPVLAATGMIGFGFAVTVPALQAFVPALVPRRDMTNAIGMSSLSFNLARSIGPGVAGLVVAAFGAGIAFLFNALSFVVFIGTLLVIGSRVNARPVRRDGADGSVRAGLRIVRDDPFIRRILVANAAMGFATDPIQTAAPAIAHLFGRGPGYVGLLVSAFGLGALVVIAIGLERLRTWFPATRMIEVGLGTLAVGMLVTAAAPNEVVAPLGYAISGAGFLMAVTTANAQLQLHITDDTRGRVMALWSVAFLGVRPFAALADGMLADRFGVRAAPVLAACVAVAAVVRLARTRHLERPATATATA